MSQFGNIIMPESRDAMFIYRFPGHLRRVLVSPFGVFKSLPRLLLAGLVILFFMGFRGSTMRVGGAVVQIGSSLMVLEMRSVFVASRHLKAPYLP
jgi:hypothetical protein